MQPFTFDMSTLSPAAGMSLGTLAGARSRARFEDHLGQATQSPPEYAPQRPPPSTQTDSPTSPSDTASSQARDRDEAADDDRSPSTDEHSAAHSGAEAIGQEAAGAVAGGNPASNDKPAGDSDDSIEAKGNRHGGKQAKSKGKLAHGGSSVEGAAPAAEQAATEDGAQASPEQTTDAADVQDQSGQDVAGERGENEKGVGAHPDPQPGARADATANGEANIAIASSANQTGETTDGSAVDKTGAVEAIGPGQAEAAEKSEPQSAGKRGRSVKATAIGDPSDTAGQPAVSSKAVAAIAATDIETGAAAELLSAEAGSAEKDSAAADASSIQNNDPTESRAGPATAATAARHDRFDGAAERSEGLTETERVRFVQRVARAFHSMSDEGGEVRLRLSPPELGSLRLEVSVRDGVMSARLEAETASARNVLLDNLPALRERLAEQNIKVERFDVDVRDDQRQAPGEQFAGQSDVPRQGQRERPRGHESRRSAVIAAITGRGSMRSDNKGELNVVI